MKKPDVENQLETLRKKETPQSSVRWYKDMIRKVGLNMTSANAVMGSDLGTLVAKPMVGDMHLYLYDPKTKDSLPYYDTAPLVIPFRSAKGGFYGINFHYLPPLLRMQLLDRLMAFSTTPEIVDTTRLRLRWEMLNNAAKFPGIQVAVKRYLFSQVESRFLRINPTDWRKVIMLPIESFVKANTSKVYRDARNKS